MRMKAHVLLTALALVSPSVRATENLPWVYETEAHPADVYAETSARPEVSGVECAIGDSAALDYFNSYWRELFQLDGQSILIYRGLLFIVK